MPALVSIIVPCFNYGDFLKQALHSIQVQTMPDWECVVVDDGSLDNTRAVAAEFVEVDPRFSYIHQVNQGLSSARNLGICQTSGNFIQLLDADDLIAPEKLASQVRFLEDNPTVDLVYGASACFKDQLREAEEEKREKYPLRWLPRVSASDFDLLTYLVRDNFLVVSAPLFRRELFSKNGGFDLTLSSHEDWEFWLRCALNGARFHFHEALNTETFIRMHESSMSSKRLEMYQSNLTIRKQLAPLLVDRRLKTINYERSLSLILEATRLVAKEDAREALKFFMANWPKRHGMLPSLLGFVNFFAVTLKTSRLGRALHASQAPL